MTRQNAALNGEWGPRVRPAMKRATAKLRRLSGKAVCSEGLEDWEAFSQEALPVGRSAKFP